MDVERHGLTQHGPAPWRTVRRRVASAALVPDSETPQAGYDDLHDEVDETVQALSAPCGRAGDAASTVSSTDRAPTTAYGSGRLTQTRDTAVYLVLVGFVVFLSAAGMVRQAIRSSRTTRDSQPASQSETDLPRRNSA